MVCPNIFLMLMIMFSVMSSFARSSTLSGEKLTIVGDGSYISTVAGSVATFEAETVFGINATTARLHSIEGVAVDAAGNIFLSTRGNVILTVTASTGIITLVAGTGATPVPAWRNSDDEGLATSATLNDLKGIALDKLGNIFVAEIGYCRIRKITVSTGVITTVAGGECAYSFDGRSILDNISATYAQLDYPLDVAVDTVGNIYIPDSRLNRVRKVSASTGIITTIAGNGKVYAVPTFPALGVAATASGSFSPRGVTVDTSGNVFFTDSFFNSIYMVAASTGFLSLVAGGNNWNYGFNGDNIPATTAFLNGPEFITTDAQGNIYFSDTRNSRVRKITASTGIIATVAGTGMSDCGTKKKSTSEVLCNPRDVAVDAAGSIYFCDLTAVRKVTYSTVAPSAAVTLAPSMTSAPVTSITAPPTATTPTTTPRPHASSGIISTVAGLEDMSNYGMAVDKKGNLLVSKFNDVVLKVTASTGRITVVAGTAGAAGFSGDGGRATSARLDSPTALALDKSGNIFVTDTRNCRIRKITVSTGIITTVAGIGFVSYNYVEPVDNIAATSSILNVPGTIAIDSAGNLYISDVRGGRLRKVTASTGIITTIAGNGKIITTLENPSAALGVAATATKFTYMNGVAVDSSYNVYFASSEYNSIFMIPASTGLLTLVAGNNTRNVGFNGDDIPATTAYLNSPSFVTVDALGNTFFTDFGNVRVRKVAAGTGIITTVVGESSNYPQCEINRRRYGTYGKDPIAVAAAASMCLIRLVAVDAAGSLYFIADDKVRKFTYSAGPASAPSTSSSSGRQVSSITHITPFSFSSAIHSTMFFFSPLFITLLYLY